jgi:hypothetical protein
LLKPGEGVGRVGKQAIDASDNARHWPLKTLRAHFEAEGDVWVTPASSKCSLGLPIAFCYPKANYRGGGDRPLREGQPATSADKAERIGPGFGQNKKRFTAMVAKKSKKTLNGFLGRSSPNLRALRG